jgi:cell wall-associated NlpC family hydrolase
MGAALGGAMAAPDDNNDAVTRLLLSRGLIPTEALTSAAASAPAGVATAASAAAATRGQRLRDRLRDGASDMVITAMNFLGVPYRSGGNTADSGFDCSGFTRLIFEMSIGLVLPRRVDEQANAAGLVEVPRDDLRPGDLVFFNTLQRTFSHVGIYVGEGKFIHAPRTGGAVRVEDMRYAYWSTRYTGARRAAAAAEAIAKP